MPTPTTPTPSADLATLTAFAAFNRVASGPRAEVLARLRSMHFPQDILVRVFDDATGSRLDLDLRPDASDQASDETGTPTLAEDATAPARAVGRPKLGVVAREVTLLPRHWDWLNRQPGGASVALRKLVEEARRANEGKDAVRASREAAYRFMTEIAGDLAGFEEATRALFAGDRERFEGLVEPWPDDVREHLAGLAAASWGQA
ncbi:DUF2239 family protein [Polaromonas sp.]|uniref:DUF2239 family protein n=1 Tax=Polaromonas sp. TaxID=1869339 RepID=UPI003BA896E8